MPVLSYQNLPLQISTQSPPQVEIPSEISLPPIPVSQSLPETEQDTPIEKSNPPKKIIESLNLPKEAENEEIKNAETIRDTRNFLETPPIKLVKRETDDKISEKFKNSQAQHLLSDTTDSEMFTKETCRPYIYPNEFTSGSDCEENFQRQSKLKSKRMTKPIYCSTATTSQADFNYSTRAYENLDESMRQEEKSRTRRKMKSEQNLSRSLMPGYKNYKNISDPHMTSRRREEIFYASKYRKGDETFHEEILDYDDDEDDDAPKETTTCNRETTDDFYSDVLGGPTFCDTHRTDTSKDPVASERLDKQTILPVKTQQLLNKSYMEYYDKLRSSNIDMNNIKNIEQQRYICQMSMGVPQVIKSRAGNSDSAQIEPIPEALAIEKFSALSNIINQNL